MSRQTFYVFDGQSLSVYPLPAYTAEYARTVMASLPDQPWLNVAISGQSFATRAATMAARYAAVRSTGAPRRVLFSDGGETELLASMTAGDLIAAASGYNTTARGTYGVGQIVGTTVPPATNYTGDQNTQREAYNAAILADPSVIAADVVADWNLAPESADPTDTTYYSDGLHPTAALAAIWGGISLAAVRVLP